MDKHQEDMVFDIEKDPYNYVMRVVFGRWKPFILQAMNTDTATNFSRFCKQLPITQKVLNTKSQSTGTGRTCLPLRDSRNAAPDGVPPYGTWKNTDSSVGCRLFLGLACDERGKSSH